MPLIIVVSIAIVVVVIVVIVTTTSISKSTTHLENTNTRISKRSEQSFAHIQSSIWTSGTSILNLCILSVALVGNSNSLTTPR